MVNRPVHAKKSSREKSLDSKKVKRRLILGASSRNHHDNQGALSQAQLNQTAMTYQPVADRQRAVTKAELNIRENEDVIQDMIRGQ